MKLNQSARAVQYNDRSTNGKIMANKGIREILALNVSRLMRTYNMSAMDVERASGGDIVNRTVGYILKEDRSVGVDMIEALGKAFKVQPHLLLKELSANDLEHLRLLSSLSSEEKQEVKKYASYLVEKRDPPS